MDTNTKSERVLLVEDSSAIQTVVKSLVSSFCNLKCVSTLAEAKAELQSYTYTLLLLDVGLPDGDGFIFCEQLRNNEAFHALSIIFLTSKDELQDRVRGLSLGADDYVSKPIEPAEFVARVKTKLVRTIPAKNLTVFIKGDFKLDLVSQKAYYSSPDAEALDLELTPIEFKLFSLFLKNEGKAFSRADLKKSVWGPAIHLSDHTIDTHVSSLRKKISPYKVSIRAIVKTGYVFEMGSTDNMAVPNENVG